MIHLSPAAPGTLRERFVADMTVRGFTDKTRRLLLASGVVTGPSRNQAGDERAE